MPVPGRKSGKPGDAFGVVPVDRISTPSATDHPHVLSSPNHTYSAKRQKLTGRAFRPTDTQHTARRPESISDTTSDRKSLTPGGSQLGTKKTVNHIHSGSINEYHHSLDMPKRSRRNRGNVMHHSSSPQVSTIPFHYTNDDDDDELSIAPYNASRKNSSLVLNRSTASLARPQHSNIIDGADGQFGLQRRRHLVEERERKGSLAAHRNVRNTSPDPLHDEFSPLEQSYKGPRKRPTPASIATRADIKPTLPKASEKPHGSSVFLLRAAICQPVWYEEDDPNDDRTSTVLGLSEEGNQLQGHRDDTLTAQRALLPWLNLEPLALQHIYFSTDSSLLKFVRPAKPAENYGAQLMLRLPDLESTNRLLAWLRCYCRSDVFVPMACDKLKQTWDKLRSHVCEKQQSSRLSESQLSESRLREHRLAPFAPFVPRPSESHSPGLSLSVLSSRESRFMESRYTRSTLQPALEAGNDEDTAITSSHFARVSNQRARPDAHNVSAIKARRLLARQENQPSSPSSVEPLGWSQMDENKDWAANWMMPLVYNRTTIDKTDIPKLDEGSFLNDNIISFGMRYLWDHASEKTKERIHLHSSFFYDKLKGATRGSINYDGVKSWTAKSNILDRDFIVVPVNENLHWWLAIICNPGRLYAPEGEESPQEEPTDAAQILSLNGPGLDIPMPDADGSLPGGLSPELGSTPVPSSGLYGRDNSDTDMPDAAASPAANPEPEQTAHRPAKKTGINRRTDPRSPRIITLDSMGNPHSLACTQLKKYLVMEFKDKKGIELDNVPASMGMTATNMPQQDNFSDCGVYLLGYMQEFIRDPDEFIAQILEKKPYMRTWTASQLRDEYRTRILHMHADYQQEQVKKKRERMLMKRAEARLPVPTKLDEVATSPHMPSSSAPDHQSMAEREGKLFASVAGQAMELVSDDETEADHDPLGNGSSFVAPGAFTQAPAPQTPSTEMHGTSQRPVSPASSVTALPSSSFRAPMPDAIEVKDDDDDLEFISSSTRPAAKRERKTFQASQSRPRPSATYGSASARRRISRRTVSPDVALSTIVLAGDESPPRLPSHAFDDPELLETLPSQSTIQSRHSSVVSNPHPQQKGPGKLVVDIPQASSKDKFNREGFAPWYDEEDCGKISAPDAKPDPPRQKPHQRSEGANKAPTKAPTSADHKVEHKSRYFIMPSSHARSSLDSAEHKATPPRPSSSRDYLQPAASSPSRAPRIVTPDRKPARHSGASIDLTQD